MATQKRKRYEYESDPGSIWILHALAEQLPDVFTAEILPKLDMKDTLNLAQVNKTYNAAVGAWVAFGRWRRSSRLTWRKLGRIG